MKLKIIEKFCHNIFRENGHFWLFCVLCIVLYVIAGYLPQMWKMWLQIIVFRRHVVLKDIFCLKWFSSNNCAASWMWMANQNLLQKHAWSFIYAKNLNETGYIGLYRDLWEDLPQKRPNFWKFNAQNFFSQNKIKQKEAQNLSSLHTTSVLK